MAINAPPNCSKMWCWSNDKNTMPVRAPICPMRKRIPPMATRGHPSRLAQGERGCLAGAEGGGACRWSFRRRGDRLLTGTERQPPSDLSTEPALRWAAVGEGLAVDEDPRREHHPTTLGELLPLGPSEVDRRHRHAVLGCQAVEDLLGLIAEHAAL